MTDDLDPRMVEHVARAILAADNGLDGDSIGAMLHEDFRIEPRNGDKGMGDLKIVGEAAARAAIKAMQSYGTPRDLPVYRFVKGPDGM